MKTQQFYAVMKPDGKWIGTAVRDRKWRSIAGARRDEMFDRMEKGEPGGYAQKTWKQLYRKGYRCYEVRLVRKVGIKKWIS